MPGVRCDPYLAVSAERVSRVTAASLSASQVASQLREIAAAGRELAISLQSRSWTGGPAYEVEIANIWHALALLQSAASTLAEEFPPKRQMISAVLDLSVFAGVLAAVPDPSRPGAFVLALLTGAAASRVFHRAWMAIEKRRYLAEDSAAGDQRIDVDARLRELCERLENLLPLLGPKNGDKSGEIAQKVCFARDWLVDAGGGAFDAGRNSPPHS